MPLVFLGGFLHWPGGAGFKCDDYAIIRYVQDFDNVLHDFVGPQYDLVFFRFWRPLITLSFWIDYQLFGVDPFGYFAMNCLALLIASVVLFALLRCLWANSNRTAFAGIVVLLWLCHPATGTALRCWAAGRVDTHYVPPLLLALLLHVWYRRGGPRWPAWVAAAVAVATKETALGFPFLALAIDVLDPRPPVRAAPRIFGHAVPGVWYLLLFPACLLLRYLVLDSPIGGYFSAPPLLVSLQIAPGGLWHLLGRVFFPETPLDVRRIGGGIVLALGLLWLLRGPGKSGRLLAAGLIGVGVFGPMIQLFEHAQSLDLRLSYVPSVLILLLWAGLSLSLPGRTRRFGVVLAVMPLLWFLPAQVRERERMDGHDAFNKSIKAALRQCDAILPEGATLIVTGEAREAKHPYRLGWGFGSVLKPPHHPRPRHIVTLSKISPTSPPALPKLVTAGLPAWVHVTKDGSRLVMATPATRDARRDRAMPVGFSGTMTLDIIGDPVSRRRAGYAMRSDFTGRIFVCSSVSSTTIMIRRPEGSSGGFVSLEEILGPLAEQFWIPLDLDKDCPFVLVFVNDSGVSVAQLFAEPSFAREYVDMFWRK